MVDGADPDALGLFHFLHRDGSHAAQFRPGEKEIQRPGQRVQQPGVRQRSNESKHQQRVNPPKRQVRRARPRVAQAGESVRDQQAHRRTLRRDAGRCLPDHAQSFHQVAGDADGEERTEHIPIRRAMPDAGGPPRPPPQEEAATDQKQESEHIQRELVEDVVSAVVEFERTGNPAHDVIQLQQRRAEQEHHESGEQRDMRPTRQAAAPHAFLAQALGQQPAHAGLHPGPDLFRISNDQFPDADGRALPPQFEPPPNPVGESRHRHHRQAVENDLRRIGDVAESLAGGSHTQAGVSGNSAFRSGQLSLTPRFSRVISGVEKENRFNGFPRRGQTAETVWPFSTPPTPRFSGMLAVLVLGRAGVTVLMCSPDQYPYCATARAPNL